MARIKFPKGMVATLESYNSKTPRMKWRHAVKGEALPTGTTIKKYGLTPEQRLAQYAPEGTTPERLVYGWLLTHKFLFTFQEPIAGGRLPGGAILDFVIYDKAPPVVLRIMSYWHDNAEAQWHDAVQQEMLLEFGFVVEDIWEREINTVERVDKKMREILFGTPKFASSNVAGPREVCPYCGDINCVRVH